MILTSKIGFGKKVSNSVSLVGGEGKVNQTHEITTDLAGKILVVLGFANREILEKADLVGVIGVVVPSMHWRDFIYFQKFGDFTLVVLSRFGEVEMEKAMVEKLKKLEGKEVILDGEAKTLTV